MSTKITLGLAILMTVVSVALGAYFYQSLPMHMVSHWGINGEANGTMDKSWGVIIMPLIAAIVIGLLFLIPKIDPLKANIEQFKKEYNLFLILLSLFFFYFQALMIFWNLGNHFDFGKFALPAIGALFVFLGWILPKTKRNYFIGIRTPWTLSSDEVWEKTHRQGRVAFVMTGLVAFFGILSPHYALFVFLAFVCFSILWLVLYSYLVYKKSSRI